MGGFRKGAGLALGALAALGCGGAEPGPPGPKLVRLIEALADAEISSPLLGVAAREEPPASADAETLWRHPAGAFAEGLRVEVEPSAYHRLRADSACAAAELVEEAADGSELRRHRFAGEALTLRTSAATAALRGGVERNPGCSGAIVLERLLLAREDELALLKAWAPAEGADPELGIAKHGQLLPVPAVAAAHPPFDHNFDFRDALLAPAPTDLAFSLRVPEAGRLRFAYALARESRPGDSAAFRVSVALEDGAPEEVFLAELAIDPEGRTWHWHEAELDLGRFAGREVRLTLSTRAPATSRGYALWAHPTLEAPRAPGDPPNVIWIAVDTLRADRLSSYGSQEVSTPHLDSLARDGVRFERAIASATWTRPSFASLFTGLSPPRHGVQDRFEPLAPELTTLTERLRAGGWFGHAILYKPFLYEDGHDQGFDSWFNVPQTARFAEQNLRKALLWIQKNAERRFFLFLHFDDPHQPLTQPYEFISPEDQAELQAFGLFLPITVEERAVRFRDPATGRQQACRACSEDLERFGPLASRLYDDEVRFVDDRIGALFAYLKERGLYDEALIAFVSDHGEGIWDHDGTYGHPLAANAWEELVQVPLIVKPPASRGLPRGVVVSEPVRAFDLMPTLLELSGLDAGAAGLEAESLVPLMQVGGEAPPGRPAFSHSLRAIALRDGSWSYHARTAPDGETLYDLATDPGERRDVAAEHPDVVREMRLRVARYQVTRQPGHFVCVSGAPPGEPLAVRVEWDAPVEWGAAQHLGLPRTAWSDSRAARFEGTALGGLELLAHFAAPPGARPRVVVEVAGTPARTAEPSPGDASGLGSPAPDGGLRVEWIDAGPGARRRPRPQEIDPQKLEALRELGYLE